MICSVEGCEKDARVRGWCLTHYNRWITRGGDPAVDLRTTKGRQDASEFWAVVRGRKGPKRCWEWPGRPYSVTTWKGEKLGVHRLAWKLAGNDIEPGQYLLHRCDNGRCCNPAHLEVGDALENRRQAQVRGRIPSGEANHFARLTNAQVRQIRRRLDQGERGAQLAREYGVSQTTISRLRHGRSYLSANFRAIST